MKFPKGKRLARHVESLPVWGEWIEIVLADHPALAGVKSLPVWGEWIEIVLEIDFYMNGKSLPVWGEWIEMPRLRPQVAMSSVSPRVGRVD